MRRIVSLKTQSIMSYIPFVNCLVLFIWLHNYRVAITDFKIFAKGLGLLFVIAIPLVFAEMLLLSIFGAYPTACDIIGIIAIYCIPLCLSRGIIRFQSKVLKM